MLTARKKFWHEFQKVTDELEKIIHLVIDIFYRQGHHQTKNTLKDKILSEETG
jgi:hypothetical protein